MNLRTDLIGIEGRWGVAGNRNLIAKDTLVRTAGVREENWDDKRAAAGYWMLDAGYWMLDAGCWFLVGGGWFLVSGHWLLVPGDWLLVSGCWILDAGCWMLEL